MTAQAFWLLLHLIIRLGYGCFVGVRSAGWWNMGAHPHIDHIVYGGSCIQAFWLTFGHPALDWWQGVRP